MVTKATQRGTARKRASSTPASRLSKTVKEAVNETAGAVKVVAETSLGAARDISGRVASALPSRRLLKTAVGRALVTGGRALIDPRAAVGEIAVRLGEGLLSDTDRLHWFVVRIDDGGHASTYGFVKRADAQAFFDTTLKVFPRQYLCESVAGPAL